MRGFSNKNSSPNALNRLRGFEACEQRYLLAADAMAGAMFSEVAAAAEPADSVAEFSILDVNPTSSTYNQQVGPSDYLGQVSAWYFGFAT